MTAPADIETDSGTAYDVAIIGGGPAGLAAALTLGRARKRVLLCDAGTPRNAAAVHIHNFVTRDGTPPSEFRHVAREQLSRYETVRLATTTVKSVQGARDAFVLATGAGAVRARRVLLCVGMVDARLPIAGFDAAWGRSVFQCPYCHGFELRGRRWGYLATDLQGLQHGFPHVLQSWTDAVTVFADPGLDIPQALREPLRQAGIQLEQTAVARLQQQDGLLSHVELSDGRKLPCEVLFAHPPQHQVAVVEQLALDLDDHGYVRVDPMTRQTSTPGIYAAGDLTSRAQGAVFAAATGAQAAAMLNHDLCLSPPVADPSGTGQ